MTKGTTALVFASGEGHLEIAKLLLANKADVNAKVEGYYSKGKTALIYASKNGNFEIVKLLIANKSNVNAKDKDGWTSFIYASESGHLEIIRLLLANKADVNAKTDSGWTSLIYASRYGHLEIVKLILANKADVNAKTDSGWTSLMFASESGHLEIVKLLLANKADVNAKIGGENSWNKGKTALIFASEKGHLEIVKLLLANRADVNAKYYDGKTALMCALQYGHLDIAKILIENKADVNVKDNDDRTALMSASASGHLEIVKFLIENKADINSFTNDKKNAFLLSSKNKHYSVFQYLISKREILKEFSLSEESIYFFQIWNQSYHFSEQQRMEIFQILKNKYLALEKEIESQERKSCISSFLWFLSYLLPDSKNSMDIDSINKNIPFSSILPEITNSRFGFSKLNPEIYYYISLYYSSLKNFTNADEYMQLAYKANTSLLAKAQNSEVFRFYFQSSNNLKKGLPYRLALERKLPKILIQDGHSGEVNHITFSQDGSRLVTASSDGTAKIWNLDGKLLTDLIGHTYDVNYAAFSPDEKRLATASRDNTAKIWDLEGKLLANLIGHTDDVNYVTFSPDAKTVATASRDNTAKLWNLEGNLLYDFKGHTNSVNHITFSPDEKTIATASDDSTVRIWDLDGKLLADLKWHTDNVNHITFSPDRKKIATASYDSTVKIWDLDGKLLSDLKGHTDNVNHITFSPDEKTIATASDDNTAKLWNLGGKLLADLKGHTRSVKYVTFSPDGKTIVTTSWDNTAKLWDLEGNLLSDLKGHIDRVNHLTFSPDGKTVATASRDKTAKLWDLEGKLLSDLKRQTDRVNHLTFSPDGKKFATASDDNSAKLWDLEGKLLSDLKGHTDNVNHIAFSPDDKTIAAASNDNTAKLWSLGGKLLADLKGHTSGVNHITFSPDGKTVATASKDKTAKLWDLEGKLLADLKGHTDSVNHITFAPDSKTIVTASSDFTAKLWNLEGKLLSDLRGHTNIITRITFSPDGKTIATSCIGKMVISFPEDKTAKLWSLEGKLLANLQGHTDMLTHITFSPDGNRVATVSGDSTAKIWDLDGKLLADLKGSVSYITFSPDGKILAAGSHENTIILWKPGTEKEPKPWKVLEGHSGSGVITFLEFRNEGKILVSSSPDNTIKFWDPNTGDLLATQMLLKEGSSLFYTPDNYYMVASENSLKYISFKKENKVYDFDQFDLKFNRPDIIMNRMKDVFLYKKQAEESAEDYQARVSDYDNKITLLKNYYENRVRRNGFEPEQLSGENKVHAADILGLRINGKDPESKGFDYKVDRDRLKLSFSIQDEKETNLDVVGYKIFVKGVPVFGQNMRKFDKPAKVQRVEEEVFLSTLADTGDSPGRNMVEIVGYTEDGIESNRMKFEIRYDFKERKKRNLYLVTLGTEKYKSGKISDLSDLRYSIADAEDMQEMFSGCYLKIFAVRDRLEMNSQSEIFQKDYSSRKNKCRILILQSGENFSLYGFDSENKWVKKEIQNNDIIFSELKRPAQERNIQKIVALASEKFGVKKSLEKNAKSSPYDAIFSLKLSDEEISRAGILKIKDLLLKTDVDDTVIFFISGHGVRADTSLETAKTIQKELGMKDLPGDLSIDKKFYNIYYYMTWDSISKTPWEKGIPMEYFRNALDGIKARQKILLIDTCQSGDKIELSGYKPSQKKLDEIRELQFSYKSRGTEKGIRRKGDSEDSEDGLSIEALDRKIYEENRKIAFEWEMKEISKMFPELRRGTGTIEISAASGSQSALESEKWKNGAFTFTIKEAILDEKAKTGDTITVKSLRKYILDRVERLTEGRQIPTVTRDIPGRDFSVVR